MILFIGLLVACASEVSPTANPQPEPTDTAVPEAKPEFRIIGYVTDSVIVDLVPFEKLTHINYAFALPQKDGTLQPLANSWKIDDLVTEAHEQDVQVLISVGGWGHDETFEALAADPEARRTFVQALVALVEKHHFDGIDMDWEYPDPVSESPDSAANYLLLMQSLAEEMRSRDKLLTAAVVALGYYGEGIDTAVFDEIDFLNLMVYDKSEGHHSDFQYAIDSLAYWQERGLPPGKMVLGVPFYGRPLWTPYRKLVAADPAAAYQDEIEYLGSREAYNGIPTIQQKTRLALDKASGIMIWTLTDDTQDETSLLQAIYNTAHKD